jgi:hypothetical protein
VQETAFRLVPAIDHHPVGSPAEAIEQYNLILDAQLGGQIF